jgi:SOS response regulatory protein OraA/RecX
MRETPTPVDTALRALRHRDLSAHELDERLRGKGFEEAERAEALETLERTGVLDDSRFAEGRARSLAARGAGDAAIRHALGLAGVAREIADDAIEALEPELERARTIAERRGAADAKTARYLRGKGFSEEAVAGVVAASNANELG